MDSVKQIFIDTLKKQGISFILMGGITYFFYLQFESVKIEFTNCNNELKDYYKTSAVQMQEVIDRNTEAIKSLEKYHEK